MPSEVLDGIGVGFPNIVRVRVDGCKDVEQALDVYVL